MGELAGITAATLEEYTTGEGVLNLEFAGFGPDWLGYMVPVSLYHRGGLIFHGKMVNFSRTNEGGAVSARAEVQNFMWLLNRQTLEQQIAAIEEDVVGSGSGDDGGSDGGGLGPGVNSIGRWGGAGQIGKHQAKQNQEGRYVVTWGNALSFRAGGSGWKVLRSRAADDDGVAVRCSYGVASRQMWTVTDKVVTTASALWKMRRKAQDVQYIIDYEAGTVTATGIGELPGMTLDTSAGTVLSISDISRQFEASVTGVAIAWTNDENKTEVHTYPEGLDMAQDGVKVFHLTGTYYVESWDTVAREYYEATNVPQWGGSVTVLMRALTASPIGCRLSLVGPGTHESWHSMGAVVTHCSWDLLAGTMTASLGREFADPEFADAEETEDGGWVMEEYERTDEGTESGSGGGWPVLSNPSDESGSGEPWVSESVSESASASASESASASASGSGSGGNCGCSDEWSALRSWQGDIEDRLDNIRECSCSHESRSDSGCDCSANWSRERRNNEELWQKLQELEIELRNIRQCSCSHEGSSSGSGSGSGSHEAKYEVEYLKLREPDGCAPGVDGWVQVLFLGGSLEWQEDYAYTYRQLMRFVEAGAKVILQVCTQRQDFDTHEWLPI